MTIRNYYTTDIAHQREPLFINNSWGTAWGKSAMLSAYWYLQNGHASDLLDFDRAKSMQISSHGCEKLEFLYEVVNHDDEYRKCTIISRWIKSRR